MPHRALYPVPKSVGEIATGSPSNRFPPISVHSLQNASSSPPSTPTAEYGRSRNRNPCPSSCKSRSAGPCSRCSVSSRCSRSGHSGWRARRETTSTALPVTGSRRVFPVSHRAVSSTTVPPRHTRTGTSSPRTPCRAAARNTTVSTRYAPPAASSSTRTSTSV